jgi:hypothetical protein
MAEVDRVQHVIPTPVITPRVSDGGQRRQPQQEERQAPQDKLDITLDETETDSMESEDVDPVEEPYRLDIAV